MADVTPRRVRSTGAMSADQENERATPARRARNDDAADAIRSRPRATWQLSPSWRKMLLSVHVIVSVGLLGADAAVLLLCIAGARGADPRTVYPAARLIGSTLLVPLALLALATGLALGLLTPWGIVRHWWITIKLALTAAGSVLALLVLAPTLGAAADAATAVAGATLPSTDRLGLVKDAAGASTVLVTTVLLSIFKPFGRLRGRRRHSAR
jgi:hypothetical protein